MALIFDIETNGFCKHLQGLNCCVPVDAGIGDRLAAGEFGKVWLELLVTLDEVGLDQHGGDGF